ncbi:MAG TPA: hypothetical protein VFO16_24180 [Pseudonocardiaceae bacterium]|nr:hypothetical protein [Pseudonocardiaceae bacterium]
MTLDINVARGLMLGDGFRKLLVGVTGPSTYTTGGDPLAAGQVRMGVIEYIPPFICTDGTNAVWGHYNIATGKIQFFWITGAPAGGAVAPEVGNGTALNTMVGRMLVYGR